MFFFFGFFLVLIGLESIESTINTFISAGTPCILFLQTDQWRKYQGNTRLLPRVLSFYCFLRAQARDTYCSFHITSGLTARGPWIYRGFQWRCWSCWQIVLMPLRPACFAVCQTSLTDGGSGPFGKVDTDEQRRGCSCHGVEGGCRVSQCIVHGIYVLPLLCTAL